MLVGIRGSILQRQEESRMWLPCGKFMKLVDLGELTSILDHVYLGCTQRECKPNETIIDEYRKMFESRISAAATQKCQGGRHLTQNRLRGLATWKNMLRSALKDIANWRTKRQSSYTESQVFAWMIIISRKRNLNHLETCQKYAHKMS